MWIKLTLLIIFCAVMILIGMISRRRTRGVDEFVLGGRAVGPWLTAFAYGTSYFSAVVFIGYAGQFGWKYGLSSTWIGIGNAVIGSLLAWVVLGRRTRLMTKHLSASTMPEFFGKRFDSRGLKLVSSAIIFVFMIPYTASVYTGLSRLFSMAFHIDYIYCRRFRRKICPLQAKQRHNADRSGSNRTARAFSQLRVFGSQSWRYNRLYHERQL